jgi:hypothetical protein
MTTMTMTRKSAFAFLLALCAQVHAQTNTFPSSGNVGIGTTAPASDITWASPALDISGTRGTAIIRTTAATGIATFRMTGPGANHIDDWDFNMAAGSASSFSIYPQAGNKGSAFTITNTGNIGIDTTSPGGDIGWASPALDISGTRGTAIIRTTAATGIATLRMTGPSANHTDDWDINMAAGSTSTFSIYPQNGASGAAFTITNTGNVGIGTGSPGYKLDVPNGTIHAQGVLVDMTGADYVFNPAYKLASLSEVEGAIKRDGHLPGIPSAQEMSSRGVSVGDLQTKLLAKVEELTLHMIAQQKELDALKTENAVMQARLNTTAK